MVTETEPRHINPLEAFLQDVREVKNNGEIRILTGDLLAYDNSLFVRSVENAKAQQDAIIRVITGPILVVNEHGHNDLLYLKEQRVINELIHCPQQNYGSYCHLIESNIGKVFYEGDYYSILTPLEERQGISLRNVGQAMRDKFYSSGANWKLFDSWVMIIRERGPTTPGVERLPLVTTMDDLRKLLAEAQRIRPASDIHYLSPEQLLELPKAQTLLKSYNPS